MLDSRESIMCGVNVGVAFFLLASSSLFMDDWRRELKLCNEFRDETGAPSEVCKRPLFYVLGASFGIIAAVIQMASAGLSFGKKFKIWPFIQIVPLILAVLAFALPMAEKANKLSADDGNGSGRFFLSCTMIDAGFLLFAIPIMFAWTKSK